MPIDGCGPRTRSPATVTVPSKLSIRPPTMLNRVDFPQPDGPITAMNSPGRTLSDTCSTAVSGPSGVSKRLTMSSTTRMLSLTAVAAGLAADVGIAAIRPLSGLNRSTAAVRLVSGDRGGDARRIARLDVHVDDRDLAGIDRGNRLGINLAQFGDVLDWPETARTLGARHAGDIGIRIADPLADPLVLDRTVAHAGDALLMHLVVVERAIVGDYEQQRNAVVHRSPDRGHAHQVIAVAADGDRQPPAAFECQRGTYRNAGPPAEPATAIGTEIVERVAKIPPPPAPGDRHVGQRHRPIPDRGSELTREMRQR